MIHFVLPLLMGGAPPGGEGAPAGPLGSLGGMIPILLLFVIIYLFMIRPQNKRQKETQRMLAALEKGDKVVTIGGIHGVIQTVREHSVVLKVDENCKVEFSRSAISSVEAKGKGEKETSSGESSE